MFLASDFTTSVHRALKEIDKNYEDYPGIVVCGTHNPKDWELHLTMIRQAIITQTPLLGICYGHQLIAIDYARHKLGIEDATSEEFGVPGTFVVKKRDGLKVGHHDGNTWWTNYDVDFETYPDLVGMVQQPFVMTVPFHPEYESYKGHPHPLLTKFISYAKMAM